MRWVCLLIAGAAVATSPWLLGQRAAQAQTSQPVEIAPGAPPAFEIQIVRVGLGEFRSLQLDDSPAESVPEPSSAIALGLLGTAFLIRRRRARLD